MARKLMRLNEIAEKAGLSLNRIYVLAMDKKTFPPAVERIGTVGFFDPRDVNYWLKSRVDRRRR